MVATFFTGALVGTFLAVAVFAGALAGALAADFFSSGFRGRLFRGHFFSRSLFSCRLLGRCLRLGVGFFGGHSWLPDYRFVYGGSQNTAKRTALRRLEQHAPTTGSGSYQISGVLATEFAWS